VCCVWNSLVWVCGSEFVLCVGQYGLVCGSECLLCVGHFGVGLGERVCAVCGTVCCGLVGVSVCCV